MSGKVNGGAGPFEIPDEDDFLGTRREAQADRKREMERAHMAQAQAPAPVTGKPRSIPFRVIDEPWALCELPDGTRVRVRTVFTSIVQTGVSPDGAPELAINFNHAMAVDPPQ